MNFTLVSLTNYECLLYTREDLLFLVIEVKSKEKVN